MATQTSTMFNPFKIATDSFQSAMESGVKFQQDAVKMMADTTFQGKTFDEGRNRFQNWFTGSMDLCKKNFDQGQKFFDDNCRKGMDMMRQSFDFMGHVPNQGDEFTKQAEQLWNNSFEMARTNMDMATKHGSEMFNQWSQCFNKACGEMRDGRKEAPGK